MFRFFKNIFEVPDLRKKVLYTLMIIMINRIGAVIPIPLIDTAAVDRFMNRSTAGSGGIMSMIDMFTGGAFRT